MDCLLGFFFCVIDSCFHMKSRSSGVSSWSTCSLFLFLFVFCEERNWPKIKFMLPCSCHFLFMSYLVFKHGKCLMETLGMITIIKWSRKRKRRLDKKCWLLTKLKLLISILSFWTIFSFFSLYYLMQFSCLVLKYLI